jgi:hypothetical protein
LFIPLAEKKKRCPQLLLDGGSLRYEIRKTVSGIASLIYPHIEIIISCSNPTHSYISYLAIGNIGAKDDRKTSIKDMDGNISNSNKN